MLTAILLFVWGNQGPQTASKVIGPAESLLGRELIYAVFDKLKRILPPVKEGLGSRAASTQRTGQRTLPLLSTKICTIPNPFTTNKDTADHAIGAIYQLMAVE